MLQFEWNRRASVPKGAYLSKSPIISNIIKYIQKNVQLSDNEGWFGSTVEASSSKVFVCGQRTGYKTYTSMSMYMGKCYTLENNYLKLLIDFTKSYEFDSSRSDKFYDNGVYGVRYSILKHFLSILIVRLAVV